MQRASAAGTSRQRFAVRARARIDALQRHERGENLAQLIGVLGMPFEIVGEPGRFAAAMPIEEGLDQRVQRPVARAGR